MVGFSECFSFGICFVFCCDKVILAMFVDFSVFVILLLNVLFVVIMIEGLICLIFWVIEVED